MIDEVVGQIQHPAHIAHHRLRRHGAEGDDLRHRIGTVFLAHIFDHALAPVLAKVHVEVGHGHPFRIQETFKQQIVAQRIEIGNAQAIGDQRARTGATSRPDRHIVVLGPVDKIRNNQKVAGEAHLDNGLGLEQQTRFIFRPLLLAHGRIEEQLIQPQHQARLRLRQHVVVEAFLIRRGKLRQLGLAQFHREIAALGDLHAIGERLRDIGEQFGHLGLGLEILFFGEGMRPARIAQHIAFGDANSRLMRLEIAAIEKLDRMRRHHRQAQFAG